MILIVGLVLLGLTLYMSTLAYALRDYSRARLSERLGNGGRHEWLDWLDAHEQELQVLTGFVRVAANLALLVWVSAWYLGRLHKALDPLALVIPALITLLLLLVFSLAVPHGLATHIGEGCLARSLRLMAALRYLLWPVAQVVRALEFIVRRLLGKPEETPDTENERLEQEILEAVSEGKEAGAVDEEQQEIIESVFELDDTAVSAIMTPRTDIHAVPAEAGYEEVREEILRSGHSRIPVYEKSLDHILGVLYAKDLLRLDQHDGFQARQIMREVPFVPETKSIAALLKEFRQSKVQMAIVLDEYGGTAGLVTIEDILEELVGEIDDEYDFQPPPAIERIDDETLEVDARVHVDEINEALDIHLPEEEDYETIGGFVFSTLGRIPSPGEEFDHDGVHFHIIASEPRKIKRLRIHVARPPEKE